MFSATSENGIVTEPDELPLTTTEDEAGTGAEPTGEMSKVRLRLSSTVKVTSRLVVLEQAFSSDIVNLGKLVISTES